LTLSNVIDINIEKLKELAPKYQPPACLNCQAELPEEQPCLVICNDCRDKEREKIYQHRLENIESALISTGIGKRYSPCSFDTFKNGEKYVKVCKKFINDPIRSLYLFGNYGSGKTHLAVSICRELLKAREEPTIIFTTGAELLLSIRRTYSNPDLAENEVINAYCEPNYLIIDDLGAEKPTEWAITTLYLIIDRRDREMMPTIITSNLSLTQISNTLGGRIASRLANSKIIEVAMPDYRRKRRQ
jgi:DNA replication protein DnaC